MNYLSYIHRLDAFALTWCMERRRARQVAAVARRISATGDGHLYWVIPLLFWLLDYAPGVDLLAATIVAFALERPLYFIMKNGFKRRRPPEIIAGFNGFVTPADRFSFPSGHTSAAFLFVTLYGSILPAATLPVIFSWAALIGLSRVLLGVHFPTDVVIGALLGTGVAMFALTVTA